MQHLQVLENCGLHLPTQRASLRTFWLRNGAGHYATLKGNDVAFYDSKKQAKEPASFQAVAVDANIVFIKEVSTGLFLDVWDADKPALKLYKQNDNENQKWFINNEVCLVSSAANPSTTLQKVYVPFTLLSMNAAYYVTENELLGSEKWMVKKCRTKYSETNGWSDVDGVSQCTKNAMDMIASATKSSFDLIGMQEMANKAPVSYLIERLAARGQEWQVFFAPIDVYLLANVKTMGRGVKFTPNGLQTIRQSDQRAFCGVWFPEVATVAVSMHVGHGYEDTLPTALSKFINSVVAQHFTATIGSLDLVKSVVIMGDFNWNVRNSALVVFGREARVYAGTPVSTCCQKPNEFDFIFTTEPQLQHPPTEIYFGLPIQVQKEIEKGNLVYQSDHLAVVSGVRNAFQ
jgi:hypothetical protein